jgi:Na+/H+ antiporter NhaA
MREVVSTCPRCKVYLYLERKIKRRNIFVPKLALISGGFFILPLLFNVSGLLFGKNYLDANLIKPFLIMAAIGIALIIYSRKHLQQCYRIMGIVYVALFSSGLLIGFVSMFLKNIPFTKDKFDFVVTDIVGLSIGALLIRYQKYRNRKGVYNK